MNTLVLKIAVILGIPLALNGCGGGDANGGSDTVANPVTSGTSTTSQNTSVTPPTSAPSGTSSVTNPTSGSTIGTAQTTTNSLAPLDLSAAGGLQPDPAFRGPFCTGGQTPTIIGFETSKGAVGASFTEIREFNAKAVNLLRWRTGLTALKVDDALDSIGERAMQDLQNGGGVHGYFIRNCMNATFGFGSKCEAGWAQENYGSASGSARGWKDGVRVALCAMMEEPFGTGHRGNIESKAWTRMGTGIRASANGASWVHEFGR
jgi:hypothetical protein